MRRIFLWASVLVLLGLAPTALQAQQNYSVFEAPFVNPRAVLVTCGDQDANCNTPAGTFHVGDTIQIYVTNGEPGWSPGILEDSFGNFFCGPFNYYEQQPFYWDFSCGGTAQFTGDLGNLSPGSNPNSFVFDTTFTAPGTYTVAATIFADQEVPVWVPEQGQFVFFGDLIPTTTVNAVGSITINVLPNDQASDADLGPCNDCEGEAGSPINLTTGNVWIPQQDYSLP